MITSTTPQPLRYPPLTPSSAAGSPSGSTPAPAPSTPVQPVPQDGSINTYA
ncbi:hypothetical protein DLM_2823 [Aquitalea magnusonii]|uniref:Uncharacterized protein n=1 Tax=Aquitalea magnusonii TaxID=332411 RepID=A0A3G9GGC7_9NEIS|nr:hypothetical protein DLM_2823 [Aquitalea magnusonii]